jgi:ABC-type multidrug transport system fused ATPase/permease subunit
VSPPSIAPRPAARGFRADFAALLRFRSLAARFILPTLVPLGLAYVVADLRGTAIRAVAKLTDAVAGACRGAGPDCKPLERATLADLWTKIGTLTGRAAAAFVPAGWGPGMTIAFVALLLTLASLLLLARDVLRIRIGTSFKERMRTELLEALAREPADRRASRGVGALVDVYRGDVDAVSMVAVFGVVGVLEAALQLTVYATLLVRSIPADRGWLLFALFVGLAALGQIISSQLTGSRERRAISGLYDEQKKALTQTTRFFELFRELTLLGGERPVGRATTRSWARVDSRNLGVRVWTGMGATVTEVLQQLNVPIILLVVALTPGGDVGAVLGAALLFAQMSGPLAGLLSFPRALAQAGPSLHTLSAALDVPDPGPLSADGRALVARTDAPTITLREVRVRFAGAETDQLTGVNLEIPAGARVGVVGVSGGGKTTLVRLIAGELTPAQGQVLIDGVDVTAWPEPWRRQLVAFMPSPPHFLLDTVRGNVEFGRQVAPATVAEALEVSRLSEALAHQPLGMDTPVLSGESFATGEQRRMALARALCSPQRILALDEPTAQLNPGMIRDIAERLMRFLGASRRTSIIITHDPELLQRTDFNVFIANGRIDVGRHDELRARNPAYSVVLEPSAAAAPA